MEKKKKHISSTTLIVLSIISICITIIATLLFLMHGQTSIANNYNDAKIQERLICKSDYVPYPLFSYDNSDSKSIEITATFKESILESIALIYKLFYDNAEKIRISESVNHGALNTLSQDEGLGPDTYEAKYSKLKDSLQFSIYANKSNFTSKALKYFMLSKLNSIYTQENISKIYTEQGLNCETQK